MASLTAAARPDLALVLAYVAHGLRDPALDVAEAALVARLAERLDATAVVLPVTVARTGGGPEEDARVVRHAALAAEAERRGAVAVLHGHHAEDQAATLLLRLARGTAPDGLGGMAPVAAGDQGPPRVRPLLRLRRADLARHCDEEGLEVAADPANLDRDLRRVRVEEEVLPALGRVGPDPVAALGRLAALAREDAAVLRDAAAAAADALPVRRLGSAVALPSAGLRALAPALGRRIVHAELARVGTATGAGPATARTVARVLDASDGARMTLPGPLLLEVGGGWHVLVPVDRDAGATAERDLALPGEVAWPAAGMRLVVVGADAVPGARAEATAAASVDAGPGLDPSRLSVRLTTPGPFLVRSRRPGDRIRTPGGTRRLGDVLAESGVPPTVRDLLPVVAAADDPG
ncbi:MAG: tRNA lysidine(34) synthetase TilS, partial [Nitriliruptoraceae bacterium]